jgi:hypothetical protein
MTTQIEAADKEVVAARARGDFFWTREGTTSVLSMVDGVAANGETFDAWVCNVEFEDSGAFKVKGLKVAGRLFEPDETVLGAKTREDVEAALIEQCKAHVRKYAPYDAVRELYFALQVFTDSVTTYRNESASEVGVWHKDYDIDRMTFNAEAQKMEPRELSDDEMRIYLSCGNVRGLYSRAVDRIRNYTESQSAMESANQALITNYRLLYPVTADIISASNDAFPDFAEHVRAARDTYREAYAAVIKEDEWTK